MKSKLMKLTVLTENTAGSKLLAEHGLSYLIEINNDKILFDTGNSDVFLKNAWQLGISIQDDIKTVVLSHGHWDHGDGLRFIENKTLILHPSAFMNRYRQRDRSYIGLAMTKKETENKFTIIESAKPYKINDSVIFLGEIPRLNKFEAKTTTFIDENDNPDFVPDDTALAIIKNNELIVVTGCSHAGICNIIDHAKKVTGIEHINTVIGGFHLKHNDTQTQNTIEYIRSQNIQNVYPSHCTELPALCAFSQKFKIKPVKTGMVFNF